MKGVVSIPTVSPGLEVTPEDEGGLPKTPEASYEMLRLGVSTVQPISNMLLPGVANEDLAAELVRTLGRIILQENSQIGGLDRELRYQDYGALPGLQAAFVDPRRRVRFRAATSLAGCGMKGHEAIALLMAPLATLEEDFALRCIKLLSIEHSLDRPGGPDPDSLRSPVVVQVLAMWLNDKRQRVQSAVRKVLTQTQLGRQVVATWEGSR